MLLTEVEAKTKFCPMTFAVTEIRSAEGSGIRDAGPWTCSASDCAAWRWNQHRDRLKTDSGDLLGYCGLAGNAAVRA